MLEYDRKKLGLHLKKIRERANLTQTEVSERVGYASAQFISNIERGVSGAPPSLLARMVKICKAKPGPVADIILSSQKLILERKLEAYGREFLDRQNKMRRRS
jgi:transcriptional regulator with XRE-family HTH domain